MVWRRKDPAERKPSKSTAPDWVNDATRFIEPTNVSANLTRARPAWTFARAPGSNLCIVVLAFDRIHYMRRVLDALQANNLADASTYVVLDGAINAFSGRKVAEPKALDAAATEVVRHFPRRAGAPPVLHRYTRNVGIGIAWFEIIDAALANHPAALFLEDDVLPSPHLVVVFRSLLERYQMDTTVMGVTGTYHTHDECVGGDGGIAGLTPDVAVERWTINQDWAFAYWRDRWRAARPTMLQYMAIVDGLDYHMAPVGTTEKIMEWHKTIGSGAVVHSQDAARMAAFRAAHYCGMVRTRARRVLPIGRRGTHINDAAFARMALNDQGNDHIRPADATADSDPGRWRECPVRVERNMGSATTSIGGMRMTCANAIQVEARRRGGTVDDVNLTSLYTDEQPAYTCESHVTLALPARFGSGRPSRRGRGARAGNDHRHHPLKRKDVSACL